MENIQTREEILDPSEAALISLQVTVRSLTRVIEHWNHTLTILKERGDSRVPAVEKFIQIEEQRQQEAQALLAKLIEARTGTIEAIEKAEG